MNENRTDAIGSLKAVAGKRTLPRLRLSIGRMMQIIVGLAFIFALIAISARTAERASRMNGQSPRCVSNLHNIVLGILGYHDANRVFPTGTWPNPDLEPESRLSWYALILPHIDRAEEQGALEKDEPWNSRQNDVYAHKYNPLLLCPNRVARAGRSRAHLLRRHRRPGSRRSHVAQERRPSGCVRLRPENDPGRYHRRSGQHDVDCRDSSNERIVASRRPCYDPRTRPRGNALHWPGRSIRRFASAQAPGWRWRTARSAGLTHRSTTRCSRRFRR